MPIACVTGGAVRVGRAICLALGQAGYDVVVHAHRSAEQASEVVQALRALGRTGWVEIADLSAREPATALAQRVGGAHPRLDLLVNSAADYEHAAFEQIAIERLERMFKVNVEAPFLLTQRLLPALRAAQGAVINITDMAVSHAYTATHQFSHYLASKAALEQLTRSWALELGPAVRVNAVAPGPVAISEQASGDQRAEILKRTPLRREGTPQDVAQAVVFLAQARYITGQVVRVDGGLSVA